jgi:hypothetical protein
MTNKIKDNEIIKDSEINKEQKDKYLVALIKKFLARNGYKYNPDAGIWKFLASKND